MSNATVSLSIRKILVRATEILKDSGDIYTTAELRIDNFSGLDADIYYQLYREDLGHSIKMKRAKDVIPMAKIMVAKSKDDK